MGSDYYSKTEEDIKKQIKSTLDTLEKETEEELWFKLKIKVIKGLTGEEGTSLKITL